MLVLPEVIGEVSQIVSSRLRTFSVVASLLISASFSLRAFFNCLRTHKTHEAQTISVVHKLHEASAARELHQEELLRQLIHQLVCWRKAAAEKGVRLGIDNSALERTLELPPPGYTRVTKIEVDDTVAIVPDWRTQKDQEALRDIIFAPSGYGHNCAHCIVTTDN